MQLAVSKSFSIDFVFYSFLWLVVFVAFIMRGLCDWELEVRME